ncbi:MAG: hydrogenase maturation nickel metallochaperone HypA, partial [Acidobacteriota bacterium]
SSPSTWRPATAPSSGKTAKTMHELSIAHSLVEIAEAALDVDGSPAVKSLNLAVGALSCVSPDALEFCFELASKDSRLEGARLSFHRLPVVINCAPCGREVELPGIQSFRCPVCGAPSSDIRQGRELEIISLEIEASDVEAGDIETGDIETDGPAAAAARENPKASENLGTGSEDPITGEGTPRRAIVA